ncbi:unnamed protein product [Angiostrongylus costaricensis]|uniref:CIA30 domain-containing protein n=1 Tax=Angiostrongylus costaricensis TaxID=334426 RepID=A0A0R3PDJ5_ANGCS|nr:unnamed protein product [Angiostrongylus costaricensis]
MDGYDEVDRSDTAHALLDARLRFITRGGPAGEAGGRRGTTRVDIHSWDEARTHTMSDVMKMDVRLDLSNGHTIGLSLSRGIHRLRFAKCSLLVGIVGCHPTCRYARLVR